ncbi:MAG: MerR family transcriptional regulator [Candidatus Methylomirabilia bacterium]
MLTQRRRTLRRSGLAARARPAHTAAPVLAGAALDLQTPRRGGRHRSSQAGPITIGEAARRSGFTIKTLRFYERRGLLPVSGRSPGGYRLYTEIDLHRLQFIREAKALGLPLDQIHELMVATREQACSMTRPKLLTLLDKRIEQTVAQIRALRWLKRELESRRQQLARRPLTDHRQGYCACLGAEPAFLGLPAPTGSISSLASPSAR